MKWGKSKISSKEELFCQYFVKLTDVREAAKKSDYSQKKGMKLLREKRILERCSRIVSEEMPTELMVVQALKRLAFGSVNDGVSLAVATDEFSKENLEDLDLFSVESINRNKAGQLDVKFYDRLKSIELLLGHIQQSEQPKSLSGLFEALNSSAKALSDSENVGV